MKPAAENLGITMADEETDPPGLYARKFNESHDGEDIRVMVRYLESERRAIANINSMYIRTSMQGVILHCGGLSCRNWLSID